MHTKPFALATLLSTLLCLLLVAAVSVPSTASASKFPHPDSTLIKVPKSIGGVKLGGSLKAAAKVWGVKDQCGSYVCSLGAFYGHSGTAEIAAAATGPKVVDLVDVRAAADRKGLKRPLFVDALGKFETKEGIGLGSRVKALKKAYPKAHKHGKKPFEEFVVKGKGKSYMSFEFDRFAGRNLITAITLSAGR